MAVGTTLGSRAVRVRQTSNPNVTPPATKLRSHQQIEAGSGRRLHEVKKIATDAVDIAFVALERVIDSFASAANRASFVAELRAMRVEISTAVAQAQSSKALDDGALQDRIEGFVARIAPCIAGEFGAQAVTAALSGDEAAARNIEARASRLEKDIEASVEAPARALEARVNDLCPRVEALDRIDDQLELRLPNGDPLNLLKVERKV